MAEVCVSCGELTEDPVWAIYADVAFQERDDKQDAFPLDEPHFTASEWIDATWWVTDPKTGESRLVSERQLRYLRAPGPGRYAYAELAGG